MEDLNVSTAWAIRYSTAVNSGLRSRSISRPNDRRGGIVGDHHRW